MHSIHRPLLTLTLMLSACAFAQGGGGGARKEEVREVADFTSVHVCCGLRAEVKAGPRSVRVSGDAELVALVQTEVDEGELMVRPVRGNKLRSWEGVRVEISVPDLQGLNASGGAHINATGSSKESFEVEATGGSEVVVAGMQPKQLEVEASGGAHVRLEGSASMVEAEASGGAVVEAPGVSAEALEADASGGSRIEFQGAQQLSAELSGGSKLKLARKAQQTEVNTSGGSEVVYSN